MAHTITLEVNLPRKEICSGCPCNNSTCTLGYWEERKYIWYNWRTNELREPTETEHELPADDGWGNSTKRPQKCIDELG